uniref:ATP synthase F0 subunit 8 n=1 Tax=Hackeriella veitchi TaxID=60873 RepID=L7N6I0_9HEMI|nr:ATP synthase F0 subunit 8 [Hackeriella veitchi]ACV96703.1 ATP synthase F0 subunit 8 [Hackeriella veitchi]
MYPSQPLIMMLCFTMIILMVMSKTYFTKTPKTNTSSQKTQPKLKW